MSLLKFMTVYDDDYGQILDRKKLYSYDLSAYPTVYFANKRPYYDGINSNSLMYSKFLEKGKINDVKPGIPSGVFEEEFKRAYNNGYIGVVVICPHAKWTDYYRNAEKAAKRFYRTVAVDEMGFRIKIINSKSFAAGTMLLALTMANWYSSFHQPIDTFFSFLDYNIEYNRTYILAKGATIFGATQGYSAYRIVNNSIVRLNIEKYPESIMYDKFAQIICDEMAAMKRDYVVSMGNSCDFAGNIIGRIEQISQKTPRCAIQYGVASTAIMGNNAICVSVV